MGMSHRSAPVALLERLSMDDSVRGDTTQSLLARPSLSEALIVSTCNRLEVYTVTNSFHTGVNDVVEVLHEVSGVDIETLRGYLYVRYADAAAEHMLMVASGLDSMVLGEQQIIGQVRTAYQVATEIGSAGPALHSLTQTALHTGKRVHTETEIDDAGASMVSFALDRALTLMGIDPQSESPLAGKTALVLGAGAMSSLAATHLGKAGVDLLIMANRTFERAERLAEHSIEAGVPAEVVEFNNRASVYDRVDLIVSATGADDFTVKPEDIPAGAQPMLVDLSMPRDIDDACADVPGVELVNIERLHKASLEGANGANPTEAAALSIVREELESFTTEQRIRDVVPAVSALRKQAASVGSDELERLRSRAPGIEDADWAEVERTVRRVVDKLMHEPTVRVKELAARSGSISYESALQELFGLEAVASAAAPATTSVNASELPDAGIVAFVNATSVTQSRE
ncbi:Glutamyl-tRNA reductase [Corynebacterium deserti GIMN1.010]|uniref:Glutamyl-tRNA reductase n=1 Tax=Corynebacterium deserti GIMN1.010 TaxID=931089 RepID=A0A0M5ITP6_9CORY|nr:Glutamyl-tRNA reductase [Corynebacterium deserti GIMN1.010]